MQLNLEEGLSGLFQTYEMPPDVRHGLRTIAANTKQARVAVRH